MTRIRAVALLAMVLSAASPAGAAATPPVGTAVGSAELSSVPGVTLTAEGYAVPLRGARPDWYTEELRRAVQSSGTVAAPAQARSRARWASVPGPG